MKALREKTPRLSFWLIETYRIHTVYRNQTCFNFRFPPASLPQLYPGDLGGVAVAGVSVEEEELVLGVFFQVPVVGQANFGIIADAAESFNLSVDSGEGNGSCLGFHNVGVDLAAIAGVAAPFRLVNSGVAAAVNTLGVLVHPLAHFFQNLHGFLWNTAFGIRPTFRRRLPPLLTHSTSI